MGRWANKYVIGLTGNIAMGKSVVRKMLEHLGAYTIDADGLAHQTMVPGAPAYQPVVEWFGRWVLDSTGKIDRSKLGAVAFSHPEALARLESITHPVVGQGIDKLIGLIKQPVVVIEAIKLLEGALGSQVDSIWVVDSTPALQLERMVQKRGMSEYEARKRIEGQNQQREKLSRANAVITNNGSLQDIWAQVEREWKRMLSSRGVTLKEADDVVRTVRVAASGATSPATAAVPTPPVQPVAPRPVQPIQAAAPSQTAAQAAVRPAATGTQPPARSTQSAPAASLPTPPPVPPATTSPVTNAPPPQQQPVQQPASKPAIQTPVKQPTSSFVTTAGEITVTIRRGMPRTAELIAQVINSATTKRLNRDDVMQLFGEKSYLLAEVSGKVYGVVGFQVENLITRVDEFILLSDAPIPAVPVALIQAVEENSKELQSEVGFFFLPTNSAPVLLQAFQTSEYLRTDLEAIKVPAWREAAQESQPSNTLIMAKKLRAERVLKPL